jgi:ABC-type dipeptide/oligopeptide/nickel transport system permease subunit
MASSVVLLLIVAAILLGPLVWRLPINEIDFAAKLEGPSWAHPLGTDDLGQDVLAAASRWRLASAPCWLPAWSAFWWGR